MDIPGITVCSTAYAVNELIDRIETLLQGQGATIYARINQQAELQKVDLRIPPLEFILFRNPSAGGRLIMENPLIALDLPLKLIAWEDAHQRVWLGYNEAAYLENRYALTSGDKSPLSLEDLVKKALVQD